MSDLSTILRGRLTPDERASIESLADRLKPGQIAQRLNRHPATINFFMVTHGLRAMTGRRQPDCRRRNGSVVRGFSPDEDAFIEALRCQAYTVRKITMLAALQFGHQRSPQTVGVRLKMLASREVGDA